jgi:chromate transporter
MRYWAWLGLINFGGPAGQIAMMHKGLVDERGWVTEAQFLRALNFCTLLPGPEAQQLATYIGWRMHGIRGGVVAGLCFILPGALLMLLLSWLVAAFGQVPLIQGVFYGIQPVVVAIVVEAVLRVGRRTLTHPLLVAFAASAFLALAFFQVPFPLIVVLAALAGFVLQRYLPEVFQPKGHTSASQQAAVMRTELPTLGRNLRVLATFGLLWLLPIGVLLVWRGPNDTLAQIALFFTQAAFVTFGGAYAVLSYIADVAVNHYHG